MFVYKFGYFGLFWVYLGVFGYVWIYMLVYLGILGYIWVYLSTSTYVPSKILPQLKDFFTRIYPSTAGLLVGRSVGDSLGRRLNMKAVRQKQLQSSPYPNPWL